MFRYNLKLTLRSLLKNKVHTLINIFGLSTGVACFILISIFVYYEWNYDNFHKDTDRIYQIYKEDLNPDGSIRGLSGNTPDPLTATLRNEYGHLGTTIGFYRVFPSDAGVEVNGQKHYGLNGVSVDPEFFTVFYFPLISGNPETCLEGPTDVVLTERAALRYFGNTDPVNKTITLRNHSFVVRGLVRNFPDNSVFKFDVFFSSHLRQAMSDQLDKAWWSSGAFNFIKLNPGIDPDDFKSAFSDIKKKHFPDWLMKVTGFDIQPLRDVHLNTDVVGQIDTTINPKYLTILLIIAIAALMIACINYVNLSTSQAGRRARETGIKKVAGASRKQLMTQHFSESITVTILAVFISMILAELFLPWFNTLTNRNLEPDFFSFRYLFAAIGLGILIGFLSGIYPGLVLLSFRPAISIKSDVTGSGRKSHFRRTLVIVQLTITLTLISTELLILKQIEYIQSVPLGYNLDNILSIPVMSIEDNSDKRYQAAKLYLQQVSPYSARYGISEGTVSENIPGYYLQNQFRIPKPGTTEEMEIQSIAIDDKFLGVFNISLVHGEGFRVEDEISNPEKILVNEAAVRELGMESPIGLTFPSGPGGEGYYTIIGVIPDLHVESLQRRIVPLMFKCGPKNNFPEFVSFRIDPDKMNETVSFLQGKWKELFPERPFEYIFPKDKYLQHYSEERRMAKILAVFVFLTISISALGILGLVLFNTQVRIKEIGIRKTFGASVTSIIRLLSKELIIWIMVALCFSALPAWFAMRQ
ncbi:MAG TPA: ABC transporter permease [Cyclobacteriaceae bacterium]|nr:ABC transporter permease [Cyclobacteriaceae bacterium]